MSDILEQATQELNGKVTDGGIGGTVKFEITGEGAIMLDDDGARIADEAADVTMTADAETYQAIFEGEMNPTSAFMSGKLTIDGDMGAAMKLGGVLAY